MIIAVVLLSSAIIIGTVISLKTRLASEPVTVLMLGITSGLVGLSTLLYLYSWFTVPTLFTLGIASSVVAAGAGVALYHARSLWQQLSWNRWYLTVWLVTVGFSTLLAPRLIETTSTGSLVTRLIHAWGDLGWHVANVTMFAAGQSLLPENPIFSEHTLSYPFLINLLSGNLLAGGFSLVQSLVIPLWLLMPVILTLFFILTHQLTQRYAAAALALVLLIGSGSTLGWLALAQDWATSSQPIFSFLTNLPSDYTGSSSHDNGYHFVNIITAALLPQRSFLFGFPLALSILYLLARGRHERRRAFFIAAGILSGLTPLAHAHTCLALLPLLILMCASDLWQERHDLRRPLRLWAEYAAWALVLGIPELAYYAAAGANETGSLFRLSLGWTSSGDNLVWFWFKNAGLLPLATVLVVFIPRIPSLVRLYAIAALTLFLAANTVAVAPWVWDNYKLLVYWLLFALPAIGWWVIHILTTKPIAAAILTLALVVLHLPAGTLDLWKLILPTAPVWEEWDAHAQALATDIRNHSSPHDTIVTAPYHNNPAALSGRPVYLGFPGHVWSHGYNYVTREQALADFYQNPLAVLPDAVPTLVVVSPFEQQQYPGLTIHPDWHLVSQRGLYQLYRVTTADVPAAVPTPTPLPTSLPEE